jgi:hypothetical protein
MSSRDQNDEQMQQALVSGVATVLSAAAALPQHDSLLGEIAMCEAADARGYFLPDIRSIWVCALRC